MHMYACECTDYSWFHTFPLPFSLSLSYFQANSARDALAKSLYIRTVVAVTRRINTLLKGASGHSPQKGHSRKPPPESNPHSEVSINKKLRVIEIMVREIRCNFYKYMYMYMYVGSTFRYIHVCVNIYLH